MCYESGLRACAAAVVSAPALWPTNGGRSFDVLGELSTEIFSDCAQSVGLVAEFSQLSNPYVFAHATRSVTKFSIMVMLDSSALPSRGLRAAEEQTSTLIGRSPL